MYWHGMPKAKAKANAAEPRNHFHAPETGQGWDPKKSNHLEISAKY